MKEMNERTNERISVKGLNCSKLTWLVVNLRNAPIISAVCPWIAVVDFHMGFPLYSFFISSTNAPMTFW